MGSARRSVVPAKNNKGISHPILSKAATGTTKPGEQSVQYPSVRQNDNRNNSNAKPRCCRSSRPRTELCIEHVSGTKKRRVSPTHLQLVSSKRICYDKEISPDKCLPRPRFSPARGLDVQNRFVTGLFSSTHKRIPQTIPSSGLPGKAAPDVMPTLRAQYGTKSVCVPNKLGSANVKRTRDTHHRLFGRLSPGTPESSSLAVSGNSCAQETTLSRLANKPRQISNDSPTEAHLSGSTVGYVEQRKNLAKRKESQPLFQDLEYSRRRLCRAKRVTEPSRSSQFLEFCGTQRQTSLSSPSRSPECVLQEETQTVFTTKRSIKRSFMVASEQSAVLLDSCATPVTFSRDRCIGPSLGSAVRQSSILRTVDQSGAGSALQSEGTPRCAEGLKSPAHVTESIHGLMAERQQNSGCVCSKRRRNEVIRTHGHNFPNFSFTRISSNSDNRSSLTRQVQQPRRSSVSLPLTSRVAPITCLHRDDIQEIRSPRCRSVCLAKCSCSSQLCVIGSERQSSDSSRRFCSPVELPLSVGFPATLPDSASASAPQSGTRHISSDSPSVESCILEVRPQVQSVGSSVHSTSLRSIPDRHIDRAPAPQRPRNDSRSLEMWGWSENLTSWDDSQLELLLSSWRPSTRKTYKIAWDRWLGWTKIHKLNPFSPSGSNLAKFLADLYIKEKLSYNTILLHKSVVATLCNTELSGHLSSHVLVKHVLKSISLKKPAVHKKMVWNIDILVSFLQNYNIDKNNLFQTSRHCAVLLLLCSGRRVHDLTLLSTDEEHYEKHDDHVILWPNFGSKTDNSDYRQSGWKLLKNSKCNNLDPVFWVNHCNDLLLDKRNAANTTNLFIHLRGPTKAASRTVIGGWVKSLLSEAGIIASPGSIRSAVASKNWADNLPIDEILSRGNWRSGNTFRKFYRREVIQVPAHHSSITSSFVPCD